MRGRAEIEFFEVLEAGDVGHHTVVGFADRTAVEADPDDPPEVIGAEASHGRFPPRRVDGAAHQATLRLPVVPHRTAGPLDRAHGLALEPGPVEVQPEQAPEDEDSDHEAPDAQAGSPTRAGTGWGPLKPPGRSA